MTLASPVEKEEALPNVLNAVRFGLLSPSVIRRMGIIEIREPTAYDEGGLPIQGGVLDPRLGTTNPRVRCPTCGNLQSMCPGHFGRIELTKPVFHIGYVRRIKDILNSTCPSCGKVLLPEEERRAYIERARKFAEENPDKVVDDGLVREVKEAVKRYTKKEKTCPHCGARIEKISLEEVFKFIVKEPEPRRLWPTEVRDRLERIPNDDCLLMGFNPETSRPEWTVMTVLLVPPPTVRPSIFLETGERSEDDLTHMLGEVVKANQKLAYSIKTGAPNSVVESEWDLLQYWVAVLFRNSISGLPLATQRGTRRPLKSLFQRLEGKEGRLRKNLVGKRVDFSSRTVISPDPMLDIDEVGVPVEIAKTLTIPEYVNESNIERMKDLVLRGPDSHPGANYVRKSGGMPINLRVVQRRGLLKALAEELQIGDVVERHLMDGDNVIFNRQPSLHRLSIMGHRVKVLPGATFRLHPGVCVPYNADFDGDEMNLHAPQLTEARVEAAKLMNVKKNMLSPRTGGSIVGARQDFVTALYYLTRKDSLFTREEASIILASAGVTDLPEPAVLSPIEMWTGKQLFSELLPKDFNMVTTAKVCPDVPSCSSPESPVDGHVMIRNGQLLSGVIDDDVVGTLVKGKRTIIDLLIRDYGEEVAADFLNRALRMAAKFVTSIGVTVSLQELLLPREAEEEIEELYRVAAERVNRKAEEFRRARRRVTGQYRTKEEMIRATLEDQMLEFEMVRDLDALRSEINSVVARHLNPESNAIVMAKIGARGSLANLAQVVGTVGQQTVKRRVGFVLTSGKPKKGFKGRVLSYFRRGDMSLEAGGFVKSGYLKGLNPAEFVFHAMSSRESLIDKGRRTEDSGYFYRRVANALKDIYVEYDGTVRDSYGRVIQFRFGGDGYDPVKLFRGEPINFDKVIERHVRGVRKRVPKKRIRQVVAGYGLPERLAEMLIEARASEKEAREVCEEVKRGFEAAKVDVLTPIGIISAQSIAEPTTQMVLRTFHAPGVLTMDVTHGVERFKELVFYASTSTPTMEIRLRGEWARDREKVEEAMRRIKEVLVRDLLSEFQIDSEGFRLVMRVDPEKMRESGVEMDELASVVKAASKGIKGRVSVEGDLILVDMPDIAEREKPYQTLRSWSMRIVSKQVRGIKGIKGINAIRQETSDGGYEYYLRTRGSNLREVLRLEFVDPTRTLTNDCREITEILGIEAGRECLLRELLKVLREQGLEVDRRYVTLVVDAMTYAGKILPIALQASGVPSGFFAVMKSPLSKMAFEWVYHVALNTAMRGERNPINGPLDALIMGQTPPVGTGRVRLSWDWEKTERLLEAIKVGRSE